MTRSSTATRGRAAAQDRLGLSERSSAKRDWSLPTDPVRDERLSASRTWMIENENFGVPQNRESLGWSWIQGAAVAASLRASTYVSALFAARGQLRSTFDELVHTWQMETMMSSLSSEICMHPAYQQIIGMGSPVLPLIFEEVENGGRHWGWALAAITRENPAEATTSQQEAAEAWLGWGREQGYGDPGNMG